MTDTDHPNSSEKKELRERMLSIEKRISRIEEYLKSIKFTKGELSSISPVFSKEKHIAESKKPPKLDFEFKIGEFGLAWLGSIVLLIGIIFLMNYSKNFGNPIVSSLIGYFSVLTVFLLANLLRKNFPHIAFMLQVSSHLLLYYVSLLLHFFTSEPLIEQFGIAIVLLLCLSIIQIYIANLKKSKVYSIMGMLLLLTTAIISDSPQIQFLLLLVICFVSFYFFLQFSWWQVLLPFLFLVYLSHLHFLLGNPLMGNPLRLLSGLEFNLYYLFGYFGIFSTTALLKSRLSVSTNLFILLLTWNGLCFSILLAIDVLFFFKDNYIGIFALLAFLSLTFSTVLKFLKSNQFEIAFYACFGFMALSVSVYGYSQLPTTFLWLALQSLLVVSMALWFKSRLITIVNTLLFIGILLSYLLYNNPKTNISFVFALVSFGSARILNWKKNRLSLRTDLMRNMYLVALLIFILYGLYHAVPKEYITLSWTASAGLFFLISILLKNFKYRWLAICSLFITIIYLFFVDLAHMELGYRVIVFFFLAVILLGVSLYYTKKIKKNPPTPWNKHQKEETKE